MGWFRISKINIGVLFKRATVASSSLAVVGPTILKLNEGWKRNVDDIQ